MNKTRMVTALVALSILLAACSAGGETPPTQGRTVQDSGGVMPGR